MQMPLLSRREMLAATSLLAAGCTRPGRSISSTAVDGIAREVMETHGVPGMAIAATVEGQRHFFNYGLASKESGRAVDRDTIFEIGSVSKTFTGTLGALAAARGVLSLSDPASKFLPELAGTGFDRITLLDLATYTAGGLPLQLPQGVSDTASMVDFYRRWRPSSAPGATRLYSNPSIGLFGHLVARSMGKPFGELMERELFPALGLASTYIDVPPSAMDRYAFGYSREGAPVRVSPAVLAAEAYGVKTTAADMLRFIEANLDGASLPPTLRRAIGLTQTGFIGNGEMAQGLGWEMYAGPLDLDRLLAGNSPEKIYEPNEVSRITPPLAPRPSAMVNKTGSTNGFGAYVLFIPARRAGVVLLANKNYPIPARIRAAHRLLIELGGASMAA